ncbi:MAG: ferritin-like domain-containing protein [Myxococcota bacterium]
MELMFVLLLVGGPMLLVGGLIGLWRGEAKVRSALAATLGSLWTALLAYVFFFWTPPSKGRVLRVNNRAQLADRAIGDGWNGSAPTIETAQLRPSERAVLGELWHLSARMEHASVAAFAKLSLRLVELGAPASLVQRAHAAALDEVRHATACFDVAGQLTGKRWTAGPLRALSGAVRPRRTRQEALDALAAGSLRDGAFAEGLAARTAERASAFASDPALAALLKVISQEERAHAELGWDIVCWCLREGAKIGVLQAVMSELAQADGALPPIVGVSEAVLKTHGVLPQRLLGRLRAQTLQHAEARLAELSSMAA